MTGKALTAAIKAIANADRTELAQTIADLAQLGEFGKAEAGGRPVIDDAHDAFSSTPSRRSINAGSGQSASGSGAERMIREYSDLAEQHGVAAAVERLAGHVADVGGRVDALEKGQINHLKLIGRVAGAAGMVDLAKGISELLKATKADDDEEEEDGDEETDDDKKKREAAEKAAAALRGEATLAGGVIDVLNALSGRGRAPAFAKADAAVQQLLDDDDVPLAQRLSLGTLAARRIAGVA